MASPVFVTSTERPPENQLILGNDELSVQKVNSLTALDKFQLEQSSSIPIKTDADLEKAKAAILKNNTTTTATAFSKTTTSGVVEPTDAEIANLEKQIAAGNKTKSACPEWLTSCPWWSSSSLSDALGLKKFFKGIGDALKSAYDLLDLSILGNIIRCAAFLITSGLKKLNEVALKVAGIGSPSMMGQVGQSVQESYGSTVVMDSKVAGVPDLMRTTFANTKTASLRVSDISGVFNNFSTPSAPYSKSRLLSPFGDLFSGITNLLGLGYISSLIKTGDMVSPGSQIGSVDYYLRNARNTSKVDTNRTTVLAAALSEPYSAKVVTTPPPALAVTETALSMDAGAVNFITGGGVPDTIISEEVLDVFNTTSEAELPTFIRNTVIGNNENDLILQAMNRKVQRAINNGTLDKLLQSTGSISVARALTHKKRFKARTYNLTKEERSKQLTELYLRRYRRVENQYA